MQLVTDNISVQELQKMSEKMFENTVKAVVDCEKGIMVIDSVMSVDLESFLLEKGSLQKNLWGINLYTKKIGNDFVEFNSLINIRPSDNNKTQGVDNPEIQKIIRSIVAERVKK